MLHNILISSGELIDKITILKIKCSVINNENNINQLENLLNIYNQISEDLRIKILPLEEDLFSVNKVIWKYENIVRSNISDEKFIESAKCIFEFNQKRNTIKKEIDKKLNSSFFDEKKHDIY